MTRTDGEYRSHGLYGMRTRAVIMLKVKSYNERDNRRTCGFGFATVGQHNRGGAADGRLTEQPWDGAKEVQHI